MSRKSSGRSWKIVASCLAGLLLVAAVLETARRSAAPATPDGDGAVPALVPSRPAIPAGGHREARPAAPAPARPSGAGSPDSGEAGAATASALLPRARAGNPDAMSRMALDLLRCARWMGESDSALRDRTVSVFRARNGREPDSDDDVAEVAAEFDRAVSYRDECRAIDPSLLASRVEWLEKAARAGDRRARIEYANWGLQDLPGREDVLMNLDEVQRRRALAGEFLQQALAQGDCRALPPLAQAYSGRVGTFDWLFRPDAARAYAYASAALQTADLSTAQREMLDGLRSESERALTPEQRNAADRILRSVGACRP